LNKVMLQSGGKIAMPNYDFYTHTACEFFPCHKGVLPEHFNCLFCFCPLYALGAECGGRFSYTPQGIKDCSGCTFPHKRENYAEICNRLSVMAAQVKQMEQNK
jgi:Zn-finger protein